jgi:valyl-tRNA synthetase
VKTHQQKRTQRKPQNKQPKMPNWKVKSTNRQKRKKKKKKKKKSHHHHHKELRLKQEKQEQQAEAKAKKVAEQGDAAAPAASTTSAAAAAGDAPFVNTTPAGEKKDLSAPMAAKYNPVAVEAAWYEWWEKSGFFKPSRPESANKFVIVIPPPNVTGSLHLGHALTNSVQDTLTRWRRMCGDDTLWVPGTDHAGIATQRVVESRLLRDEKKTRHDLGRDAFVARVWEWKQKYGSYICKQLRLLGSSLDWDREAFTMDDNLSAAVTECFVRFFDDGLIYRANRLVNWCCALETAISDIEVEYIDIEKPTKLKVPGHDENKRYPFGVIVKFAYKVVGSDTDELVVATTRIETMLGDTAVAVHPDDARYKHLHGKMLQHPFVDRQIPIVLDAVLVNMEFGTGAVKVTPAHDPNDYQAGKRNNLEFINIFTTSGLMNENTGQFAGMKRFDARLAVLDALRAKGLHRGEDPNPMRLGLCSRTNDVIEPMMQPQWWVAMKDMADDAVALVRSGELEIVPKQPHETTWYAFLENCQDWCISRQLWWGHQVPAWLVCIDGAPLSSTETASWVAARSEVEALAKARAKHATVDAARITLRRDPDVLDTWFSSGLFPFSVFGWPRETADMARFFPTSVLETGHDILFFWVARMVMMSRRLTGKLPFKRVLLHAMVRDAHGRKMSKSLGNVIDPMDVMRGISLEQLHEQLRGGNLPAAEVEVAIKGQQADYPNGIPECGTDALRFGLCAYMSQGRSINLDVARVVAYRHFCNKLWNVTRFALTHLPAGEFVPLSHAAAASAWANSGALHSLERWMLASVRRAIAGVNENFASFNLGNAVQAVYVLWYDELCDKFLEAIKPIMYAGANADATSAQKALRASVQQTLYSTLDIGLRLLHPLMPFVTEELWQRLPRRPGETSPTIMLCAFPIEATAPPADAAATADVQLAFAAINAVRSLRGAYQITSKVQTPLQLRCVSAAVRDALLPLQASIVFLSSSTGGECVLAAEAGPVPPGTAVLAATAEVEAHLAVGALIDCAALRTSTQAKLEKVQTKLDQLRTRMSGSGYANVAEVAREKDRENLALWETEVDTHQKSIANFESFLAQQSK